MPRTNPLQVVDHFFRGTRLGFGDSMQAIHLAERAAVRRPINWVLPGLLGLLILILLTGYTLASQDNPGIGYLSGRIILFDYGIFVCGWICGWNAAGKWRRNQGFIEEIVVTNLRPPVVGHLLFAGGLAIWSRVVIVLALADILLVGTITILSGDSRWVGFGDFNAVSLVSSLTLVVLTHLLVAWFHLETIRIAYWMFATASLPRISLATKALINLLMIILYVSVLTGIGSAITGISGIILSLVAELIVDSSNLMYGGPGFDLHLAWMIAAIPGLAMVVWLKRLVSRMYEQDFTKTFLLFTWWGAGETHHPTAYPLGMIQQVGPWVVYLRQEEAHNLLKAKEAELQAPPPPEKLP